MESSSTKVRWKRALMWYCAVVGTISVVVCVFLHGPFDRIHQWNCDKIKKGMTRDDVAAILGRRSSSFMPGVGEGPNDVVRVWSGWTDWRMITVIFDEDGKVTR